jgi:hypothetical protein
MIFIIFKNYLKLGTTYWTLSAGLTRLKLLSKDTEESLQKLIRDVSTSPAIGSHTRFYLTEKAGEQWTPVPLMQILKNLHELHRDNPAKSTLRCWGSLTEEIIGNLNELTD